MEVKLAKTAGFCMGVRRAVDIVLKIAQQEKSLKQTRMSERQSLSAQESYTLFVSIHTASLICRLQL